MFGCSRAAEDSEPWAKKKKKKKRPKIPSLLGVTPSILGLCLGQMAKYTLSLVSHNLKVF